MLMATRRTKPKRLRKDLADVRVRLQNVGRALLEAAATTLTAAAEDTLEATAGAITAAEKTLASAHRKLRKVRAQVARRKPLKARAKASPPMPS
jgi:uncharacterized coiled-coil protein SlyX